MPRAQVNLPKPIGVKFGRGNDGAAYVLKSDPNLGNTDDKIQVRLLRTPQGHSAAPATTGHLARLSDRQRAPAEVL